MKVEVYHYGWDATKQQHFHFNDGALFPIIKCDWKYGIYEIWEQYLDGEFNRCITHHLDSLPPNIVYY